MITSTVTFQSAMGKNAQAIEFLQKFAAQLKEVTGVERRLLSRVGGPMGQFVLVSSFEDFAAFDAARSKVVGSAAIQQLLAHAGADQLFAGASEMALWADA